MVSQDKLIKTGIQYTDALFEEIIRRLQNGVRQSDTLEEFLEKTKEYTTANPVVTTGYDSTMLQLILSETNNHKFSRPSQRELTRITIENYVGEDVKQTVRDIATEEYNNPEGSNPQKLAKRISEEVTGIKKKRARAIARTEIKRTATISDYIINKERGAIGFTVRCRSTRCPKCQEVYCKDQSPGSKSLGGDVFYSMDQVDKLPPLHVNCRCSAEYQYDMSKYKGKVRVVRE